MKLFKKTMYVFPWVIALMMGGYICTLESRISSLENGTQAVSNISKAVGVLGDKVNKLETQNGEQGEFLKNLNEDCYRLEKAIEGGKTAGSKVSAASPYGDGAVFEATAYTDGGITANGYDLTGKSWGDAMVVAVDPDVIPLGTQIYVEFGDGWEHKSGIYTAQDTGGAIIGNIIDVFVGHDEDDLAMQFGRRDVKVTILA